MLKKSKHQDNEPKTFFSKPYWSRGAFFNNSAITVFSSSSDKKKTSLLYFEICFFKNKHNFPQIWEVGVLETPKRQESAETLPVAFISGWLTTKIVFHFKLVVLKLS